MYSNLQLYVRRIVADAASGNREAQKELRALWQQFPDSLGEKLVITGIEFVQVLVNPFIDDDRDLLAKYVEAFPGAPSEDLEVTAKYLGPGKTSSQF